jgi:tRNA uridine 5-carboxymethylaminomethyl modification enzyme
MFTGRSEYRVTLRSDNADLRLTNRGYKIGCVGEKRYEAYRKFENNYYNLINTLESFNKSVHSWKSNIRNLPMEIDNPYKKNIVELLAIDGVHLSHFKSYLDENLKGGELKELINSDAKLVERIEIYCKYKFAEKRQSGEIGEIRKNESVVLPTDFDYSLIEMSKEAREKLQNHKPTSIGSATRIPGVTPTAIYQLLKHFKNNQRQQANFF